MAYPNILAKQFDFSRVFIPENLKKVQDYSPYDLELNFIAQQYNLGFEDLEVENEGELDHLLDGLDMDRVHSEPMDLAMVVARELTKAMGASSNLERYSEPNRYAGPEIISNSSHHYLSYISPFDSFIYGVPPLSGNKRTRSSEVISNRERLGQSVANIAKEMEAIQLIVYSGPNLDSLTIPVASNIPSFAASTRKIYQSITTPGLELRFSSGVRIPLQSLRLQDRLLTLDASLSTTPDFLLSDFDLRGVRLSTRMREFAMKSIYGPKTLSLLEAIGWPTRRNPNHIKLQAVKGASDFFTMWDDAQTQTTA